jgi:hypothetical protein
MYTYFIAYFYIDGLGRDRMGNTFVDVPRAITQKRDIRQIEAFLESRYPKHLYIAVTNFQLMSTPSVGIEVEDKLQEKGEVVC